MPKRPDVFHPGKTGYSHFKQFSTNGAATPQLIFGANRKRWAVCLNIIGSTSQVSFHFGQSGDIGFGDSFTIRSGLGFAPIISHNDIGGVIHENIYVIDAGGAALVGGGEFYLCDYPCPLCFP